MERPFKVPLGVEGAFRAMLEVDGDIDVLDLETDRVDLADGGAGGAVSLRSLEADLSVRRRVSGSID